MFVSHTVLDKLEYAKPVAEFLEGHNIDVFMDQISLAPGEKPTRIMLSAAVSCQYMW